MTKKQNSKAKALALTAAKLAAERHCTNIVVMDLTGISPATDYFVIATGKMHSVREFLELANFLSKYYQNYIRIYLKFLLNFLVFGSVGMFLRFSPQSPELFQLIGLALVFFSGIGFAVTHSKFVMKRELYLMTRYTLNSYFMMV